ncbi:LOW QUALITY PROTEIN: serine/threonine/tyrosine-interacting-like protein 1 [Myotis lucifugus]|uniref:LOW QUALITY PROTEIN: serine/threonine/tyrosine-interacting-like protein 1 n=1 Tax=Myotis lucifugus TaxID=59463 RepID=UPI0003C454F2|nr:LOW QUALITY PROTEIN: serine/threonine/tyrosine-interacting-like protein 1 [Myotis lucifugus]
MADLVLCEPTELYNILNQVTKLSRLTEPNYLCLLDVRSKQEYDESHVITARRVKKKADEYLIPESVDLECVKYCVVYDNNSSCLDLIRDDSDNSGSENDLLPRGAAIECGKALAHLTRHPVQILRGGYESFSAKYHFFRTQKIIWMPQELDEFQPYPVEIVPGSIDWSSLSFVGDADKLLHIQIEDSPEAFIFPFLRHLCHFIDVHLELGNVILVFSTLGISRSCGVILAYLMHQNEQTLKKSWEHVKKCKNNVCPNRALVAQLSQWETIVLGGFITDISVPLC